MFYSFPSLDIDATTRVGVTKVQRLDILKKEILMTSAISEQEIKVQDMEYKVVTYFGHLITVLNIYFYH